MGCRKKPVPQTLSPRHYGLREKHLGRQTRYRQSHSSNFRSFANLLPWLPAKYLPSTASFQRWTEPVGMFLPHSVMW